MIIVGNKGPKVYQKISPTPSRHLAWTVDAGQDGSMVPCGLHRNYDSTIWILQEEFSMTNQTRRQFPPVFFCLTVVSKIHLFPNDCQRSSLFCPNTTLIQAFITSSLDYCMITAMQCTLYQNQEGLHCSPTADAKRDCPIFIWKAKVHHSNFSFPSLASSSFINPF